MHARIALGQRSPVGEIGGVVQPVHIVPHVGRRGGLDRRHAAALEHGGGSGPAGGAGRLRDEGPLVLDRRIGLGIEQRVLGAGAGFAVHHQPGLVLEAAHRVLRARPVTAIRLQVAARQLAIQRLLQAPHLGPAGPFLSTVICLSAANLAMPRRMRSHRRRRHSRNGLCAPCVRHRGKAARQRERRQAGYSASISPNARIRRRARLSGLVSGGW